MTLSTLEVLGKAREIVADESRWATSAICTHDGRFCALGALGHVLGYSNEAMRAMDMYTPIAEHPAGLAVARATGWTDAYLGDTASSAIYRVNDRGHHGKVVALLDRAIADEHARMQEQVAGAPLAVPAPQIAQPV